MAGGGGNGVVLAGGDEHGYEWGIPWQYSIEQSPTQAAVTLWDSQASDRIRARITITLSAGRSSFSVSPRIENPTSQPVRYQFWLNVMLASGGSNNVSEATEFFLPSAQMTVHSTGDGSLPKDGQAMPWPTVNGRALNLYSTWRTYLGVFARPRAQADVMGAYDHASGEGVLRIFPSDIAGGAKLFGSKGLDPNSWTDGGSVYYELHGGVTPTFWDDATLAPGAVVTWSEDWYPYTTIGSIKAANAEATLALDAVQGGYRVGAAVTARRSGRLVVSSGAQDVWSKQVDLAPEHTFYETTAISAANATLRFEDGQGRLIVATP